MGDGRDEEGRGDLVHGLVVVGKDEDAVAWMGLEDVFEHSELDGGAQGDLAMAAIRLHGPSAAGALRREHDEVPPAVFGAEADVLVGEEGSELVACGLVLDALLGDHIYLAAFDSVVGEVFARQGADAALVRARPDEGVEEHVAAVGAFGRGRQPEPIGRDAHFSGVAVHFSGQVMHLVKDRQAEAVAVAVEIPIRAVVGGNG